MIHVVKRDGEIVLFDPDKIIKAINKAAKNTVKGVDSALAEKIADEISNIKEDKSVEDIQDAIVKKLMASSRKDIAEKYVIYRNKRSEFREANSKLMREISVKLSAKDVQNQNANVDEKSFGGRMGEANDVVMKKFALEHCMSKMARKNHENNEIYIHDLNSYSVGSHNCADGSMWIRVKQDGFPRTISLSDFAKELNIGEGRIADVSKSDFEILSKDGWTKLLNVSCRRLKDSEKLFTINTRTGLPLKLTGKHRVPVVENGKEIVKNVEDLTTGDVLLNVGDIQLSTEEIASSFMDLTKLNDPAMDLRIVNLSPLKSYLRYKYNIQFSEYAKKNKFRFPANAAYLDIHDYEKLCREYPLSFELISQLRIKSCGSKHDYPLFIPYTKELAKVYAYIYADGGVYIDESQSLFQLTFTNTNEALVDDFVDCYESCFGYRLNKSYAKSWHTSPCTRVTDGSRLIVKIFKEYAGARKFGANDISMPDFVMNGSNDIKYAYLSACIDTDGCMGSVISYTSCCKQYCDQLCMVLESLGYHPTVIQDGRKGDVYRFGVKTGHRNFDSYRVSVYRGDEKYTLQSKMSTLKYNDGYCYRGMTGKYNENKIISISSSCPRTLVYDMETMSHWYVINNYVSHNCLSIPFDKLLANGFNTRQTDIRPANSVNTAFQLVAVIFQLQSLNQFGGVSATHLDWTMVPYVRKSFTKYIKNGLIYIEKKSEYKTERFDKWLKYNNHSDGTIHLDDEEFKNQHPDAWEYAMDMTTKEVYQAVEGMFHNLNTLQSRSGNQLPFTSINYGTCTLPEGRMVIKALLDVAISGVGKLHKTSVFPCCIFQYDKKVNGQKGAPNYDLYRLALKCTAKRLYPNYCNTAWSNQHSAIMDDRNMKREVLESLTEKQKDVLLVKLKNNPELAEKLDIIVDNNKLSINIDKEHPYEINSTMGYFYGSSKIF